MQVVDVLAAVVDTAFPLLQPDIDFYCPDCYLLPLVFPVFPLLGVRRYSNQELKDGHAQADCL